MNVFKIGNKLIGEGHPCFIIAEAGVNHNGNLEMAKALVDVAVAAGADAFKIQLLTAKGLYVEDAGKFKTDTGVEGDIYEIWKNSEVPESWFPELKSYCEEKGIIFFSSVFEESLVEILDKYTYLHKIGSSETTHVPLLKSVARTGKPVLLAIGGATMEEVEEAVQTIMDEGNEKVAILHCVQQYPTPLNNANVLAIKTLKEKFPNLIVGYSDHSMDPSAVPVASIALGAKIIEKHFTLSRHLKGIDHRMSLEPDELKKLVFDIREAEKKFNNNESILIDHKLLGDGNIVLTPEQTQTLKFVRRKIFAKENIKKGEVFSKENLLVVRPGNRDVTGGLHPREYEKIIGKRSSKDIQRLDLITAEHISSQDDLKIGFTIKSTVESDLSAQSNNSVREDHINLEEHFDEQGAVQGVDKKIDNGMITSKVIESFKEVFPELSSIELNASSEQFENWDSFSHIELVSKIEEKFDVNLDVEEIIDLDSPQKFIDLVEKKLINN